MIAPAVVVGISGNKWLYACTAVSVKYNRPYKCLSTSSRDSQFLSPSAPHLSGKTKLPADANKVAESHTMD